MAGLWHLEFFTPASPGTEPIQIVLKECGKGNNEPLVKWGNAKLQELQFVSVLGALMASLLCSAFTWPLVEKTFWVVTALWYSGLALIIGSVATATQQSITLSRFSCLPDYNERVKDMLCYSAQNNQLVPRFGVAFISQIPVMMLRFGVYFFLTGMGVLLGYSAWQNGGMYSPEVKTVTMFAVVTTFALGCHAASVGSSYSRWRILRSKKAGNNDGIFNSQATEDI